MTSSNRKKRCRIQNGIFRHPKNNGEDAKFFRSLPESHRIFAIPYGLSKQGIQKYGRQGMVHQWALKKIGAVIKKKPLKIITIFINGHTNVVATKNDHPIEVSNGFSLTDGVFSETGCGAIDSSIVFQLLAGRTSRMRIQDLLSKQSGFKALAGGSVKLKSILGRRDPKAKFAREVFCYQILKYIGAYAASLGGVDLILFIGEANLENVGFARQLIGHLKFMGFKPKPNFSVGKSSFLTGEKASVKAYFLNYKDA